MGSFPNEKGKEYREKKGRVNHHGQKKVLSKTRKKRRNVKE